jgi:hypothetical protein
MLYKSALSILLTIQHSLYGGVANFNKLIHAGIKEFMANERIVRTTDDWEINWCISIENHINIIVNRRLLCNKGPDSGHIVGVAS